MPVRLACLGCARVGGLVHEDLGPAALVDHAFRIFLLRRQSDSLLIEFSRPRHVGGWDVSANWCGSQHLILPLKLPVECLVDPRSAIELDDRTGHDPRLVGRHEGGDGRYLRERGQATQESRAGHRGQGGINVNPCSSGVLRDRSSQGVGFGDRVRLQETQSCSTPRLERQSRRAASRQAEALVFLRSPPR